MSDGTDQRCIVEILEDDAATTEARRQHTRGTGLADGMTIEALPTSYRKTMFRSALEASWAATLDSLGLTWQYEPQLVTLPSRTKYLPDFRLPEIGAWLEVKGTGVPRVEKAYEFSETLACDCPRIRGIRRCTCPWPGGQLVVIGNPPSPMHPDAHEEYDHWPLHSKRRLAWRHGGFLSWTSARSTRLWLTRCPRCDLVTWFDSPFCRACRSHLSGTHGSHSGDGTFLFTRISGGALPDNEDDTAA